MDMKLTDVAQLLNVDEKEVHQWVEEGKLPAYKMHNEYRFNREQVELWMMDHLGETGAEGQSGINRYSLFRALHKGNIYTDIAGSTKEEIISGTTERLAENFELDADVLRELLLDREKLGSTAIGSGVAIPHTRDFLLQNHFDVVTIVFPEKPLDYGALDGQPAHSLFFLFACRDTHHLDLLAKIAHFSKSQENLDFLASQPEKRALLEYISQWESGLTQA